MARTLEISARWITDDSIWIATSADVPGLVIEGATWTDMIREVRLALPELLEPDATADGTEVLFRAEERLDLAAA